MAATLSKQRNVKEAPYNLQTGPCDRLRNNTNAGGQLVEAKRPDQEWMCAG